MNGPVLYCKTCERYVVAQINKDDVMCPHEIYHLYCNLKDNLDNIWR
jgi:hypothetical protein